MSSLLTRYNKGLKAKNAIKQVRNFKYPPVKEVVDQIKHLCGLVDTGFRLEEFPGPEASIPVMGKWVKKQYLSLCKAVGASKMLEDVLDPIVPQSEDELTQFLSHDPKMTELLASAISKWLKDANTYEQARQGSIVKQLSKANVPDQDIQDLINNPMESRKFIQEQRAVLVNQLTQIQRKIQANNPLQLATLKEKELLEKHSKWFGKESADEENPYPNDNVVVYTLLFVEVFMIIKANDTIASEKKAKQKKDLEEKGAIEPEVTMMDKQADYSLWSAFEMFSQIFMNAKANDSDNKVWSNLKDCPDYHHAGFNVGKAIKDYVGDQIRCAKSMKANSAPKLQSGLQRGPRRLDRMISITVPCTSQFTILNLDGVKLVQNLVELYNREQVAQNAVNNAMSIQKGAEGLSDAESIAWLCCLGRQRMLPFATGRNDCSFPKLVGGLVNIDVTAFADLPPRPWSVVVRGR